MTRYVVILGSPNSVDGNLSQISTNRIKKAIEVQKNDPGVIILATGGFGAHFNTSKLPHRDIVYRYLLEQGAKIEIGSPSDLHSSNTVEDASLLLDFMSIRGVEKFGIVTSKFHMPRVEYIFQSIFEVGMVEFIPAEDPPDLNPEIFRHEKAAMTQLEAQGGVLDGGVMYLNNHSQSIQKQYTDR